MTPYKRNFFILDMPQTPEYTREFQTLMSRIVSFERACEISAGARTQGRKIVFTSGSWDIIHVAHLHYLQHLKSKGNLLIIGVDSNASVQRLKGEEYPVFDELDRAMMIANFRFVDYVFIFEGVWQVSHLLKLKPDFVGVPPFDPNMESKLEKIRLAGAEFIVTPPFLGSDHGSRKARILKHDYLMTNIIHE